MKHRENRDFKIEFFRGNSKWFCKDKISVWQIILSTSFRQLFSLSSGGFAIYRCTINYYVFLIR